MLLNGFMLWASYVIENRVGRRNEVLVVLENLTVTRAHMLGCGGRWVATGPFLRG